jgi:hypothetical protein
VRSGTESRLDRDASGVVVVAAVVGTAPVVAQAGLCTAHSSVESDAGGDAGADGCIAGDTRWVGSVTPRSDAPQLAQKSCPASTGFPHWWHTM